MNKVEYEANTKCYEDRYRSGYGLRYPDGHVIRFHRHILEYDVPLAGGNMLDFGCGTGTHLAYFKNHGFTPYGCDVSAAAIEQCKQIMPEHANHFHVVPSTTQLRDYFGVDFDLVFSNQVLYFLNDRDMDHVLKQLYSVLKPGGIFFATMIATTNYYSRLVEGTQDGLSKVVESGRINSTCFVNFKTRDQVLELFTRHGFRKLQLGHYGAVIREDEGASDHHLFVGKKD